MTEIKNKYYFFKRVDEVLEETTIPKESRQDFADFYDIDEHPISIRVPKLPPGRRTLDWYGFLLWLAAVRQGKPTPYLTEFQNKIAAFTKTQLYKAASRYMDMQDTVWSIFDIAKNFSEGTLRIRDKDFTLRERQQLRQVYPDYNGPQVRIILLNESIAYVDRGIEIKETITVNQLASFEIRQIVDIKVPNIRQMLVKIINIITPHLRVEPSTYAKAGYGLFAHRKFEKGETITTYGGFTALRNYSDGLPKKRQSAYTITVWPSKGGNPLYVEGERFFQIRQLGRWINQANDPEEVNVFFRDDFEGKNYRKFEIQVVAQRDIRKGEELFLDYGETYGEINACAVCGETDSEQMFHCVETKCFFCDEICQEAF